SWFKDGVAIVDNNHDGCGAIDKTGSPVIPFGKYDYIERNKDGKIIGINYHEYEGRENSYAMLDSKGNLIGNYNYNPTCLNDEELTIFYDEESERYGYKDTIGAVKIPIQFEDATVFSKGIALVRINNNVCLINNNGEILIPNLARRMGCWWLS
ncbi:MAG: WG repeat-containing protein, partial [Muribaculaceae bacterium]|nr:WG repeat-containing protein [Muribaculaceae bacterium]